jgi:hypothetical protein
MKEHGERATPGEAGGKPSDIDGNTRTPSTPTLTDLGVSNSQSSRWQKLASVLMAFSFDEAVSGQSRVTNLHRQAKKRCAIVANAWNE